MTTHFGSKYTASLPAPRTPIIGGFQPGEPFTLVRPLLASVAAIDTAPFNATTFPPATSGFGCDRYETVYVGALFAGSGTLQVSPMFYDIDAQIWVDLVVGGSVQLTDNLDGSGTKLSELRVFGRHAVFFKIQAMTGGPLTNVEIYAMPGRGRENAFFG